MKAFIVYDSMFGNTEQVAQVMATALADYAQVALCRVGDVSPAALTGLDVLIVGSPTQGFQPTPAIKKLLDSLPAQGLKGVNVAAFDTRVDVEDVDNRLLTILVNLFGYAAKPIANRLQKKGGNLVMPPEGFLVDGKEGPLKAGERERAADWAKQVAKTPMPATELMAAR